MEQKPVLFSSLALGLGLGLGLGLASSKSQAFQQWNALSSPSSQIGQLLELELMARVVPGADFGVSFNEFPYYLNEQTRILLTNAAYVHLKQAQFAKFTRNLSPASKTILLTGPAGAEIYQQTLAKALAHFFEAKLLLLDVTDFSLKFQCKHGDLRIPGGSLVWKAPSKSSMGTLVDRFVGLLVPVAGTMNGLTTFSPVRADIKEEHRQKNSNLGLRDPSLANQGVDSDALSKRGQGLEIISVKTTSSAKASTLKKQNSWAFEERIFLTSLFHVLSNLSQTGPVVLYLRDVEKLILRGPKTISLLHKTLNKLSGPVLVLGSRLLDSSLKQDNELISQKLADLFPYNIDIKPPEDDERIVSWKRQLEEDLKAVQSHDNRNYLSEVLAANDVECDDLASICFSDTIMLGDYIEEIVVSAISHHLMNTEEPEYRAGRLVITSKSLAHGLSIFQAGQLDEKDAKCQMEAQQEPAKEPQESSAKMETKNETLSESKPDVEKSDTPKPECSKKGDTDGSKTTPASASKPPGTAPDNEFEKRIRPEVIPAGEIGVTFNDIGALDNVKEALQELVMLPLRRPDLFNRGGIIKPCKGILLFGPPGTGKTMLAKAVATEAGASFINVSMSTITSKWFGEDEKNVRALFTLAAKVSPTVIFIDEVDSMLGQRSRVGEHEAMRKIKNEFMAHWDGLLTKSGERVLVLAATNRPFDLDEAIIRRFERRIMVGLPSTENREKILRTILAKENVTKDFDYTELAAMTEGYSGSDLKNLCTAAAYLPLRDFLRKEQQQEAEKKAVQESTTENKESSEQSDGSLNNETGEKSSSVDTNAPDKVEPQAQACELDLRPLTMKDMKQAKNQVPASFAAEGAGMAELKEWNELYGEGGSRKKQQLTYFL